MITLKELATILNLSPSTISKSLNDSPEISFETKRKVRKLAKNHGYIPNYNARSLKLRRSKNIGVVIPNILDEFFAMVLQGIENEANKQGYNVMICISDDLTKKEEGGLNAFISGRVDGILISLASQTQFSGSYGHLKKRLGARVPIVLFDRISKELDCDKVSVDDFKAACMATEYLIQTGCKNIAFLSTISKTSVGKQREEGYRSILRLGGQELFKPQIIRIPDYDSFEATLKKHLREYPVDAILAADERSAVCAMNMVQRHGYSIPDDISFIGFTDGSMGRYSNPPLTSVSQHAEDMGKMAVRTLIDRLEEYNTGKATHQLVRTELVIRESTRPLGD